MRSLGIDPQLYRADDNIVLARPQWIKPLNSLAGQGMDLELNQSAELDRVHGSGAAAAALFFHEPPLLRLPSFDAKSPFKGADAAGGPAAAGRGVESAALRACDRHAGCRHLD